MNAAQLVDYERSLTERQKELQCLYTISQVAASDMVGTQALQVIARALAQAMQEPEHARCRIEVNGESIQSQDEPADPDTDSDDAIPRISAHRADLSITLWYLPPAACGFLREERALLDSCADICAAIVAKQRWVQALQDASERLASKNSALRELLNLIEEEHRETSLDTERKLRKSAFPLLEQLRQSKLDEKHRLALLDALETELRCLGTPYTLESRSASPTASLSPREREIIRLLRSGSSSRQIAERLRLSVATIDRHRHNIRKKLGLVGSDANLAGLLMEEPGI